MADKCLLVLLGPRGDGHPLFILPFSTYFVLVVGVSISFLSFDLCVTMGFSKLDIEKVFLNIDVKFL